MGQLFDACAYDVENKKCCVFHAVRLFSGFVVEILLFKIGLEPEANVLVLPLCLLHRMRLLANLD